jgi:hypothetical protein
LRAAFSSIRRISADVNNGQFRLFDCAVEAADSLDFRVERQSKIRLTSERKDDKQNKKIQPLVAFSWRAYPFNLSKNSQMFRPLLLVIQALKKMPFAMILLKTQ